MKFMVPVLVIIATAWAVHGGVLPNGNKCQSVSCYQKQIKDHKTNQAKYDGSGKRVYTSIDDVMKDVKRPYHPNVGFYEPLNPRPALNDIRCTRQGMLGCGDRCFIPHTYTRCVNGRVTGPEAKLP